MKKGILAIGASGTVCLEVIKKLSEKGINVRVGSKNPEKAKAMGLKNVDIFPFDYSKQETFEQIFEGIEKWFLVSPSPAYKLHETVFKVIDEAKKKGVKQVVNVSMMGINKADHPFWLIEDYIASKGFDFSVLRPNCYMQHFNDFLRGCFKEECMIKVPAGNSKVSFVDMRDVAEVAVQLITGESQKNKTYSLTGDKAYNLQEVAQIFSEVLGREIKYLSISNEEYEEILVDLGFSDPAIQEAFLLCDQVKNGLNSIVTSDIFNLLGREPTTIKQFAADYAELWG
ncbi:MAG: hypothetical protein A2V66_05800 [Ignavibacteria bacterium RBG_13_36_8]|nr:MAG: hypothetical protein A2V66_05800 [Ignavibacteria bacterium RBG_13_36_8]